MRLPLLIAALALWGCGGDTEPLIHCADSSAEGATSSVDSSASGHDAAMRDALDATAPDALDADASTDAATDSDLGDCGGAPAGGSADADAADSSGAHDALAVDALSNDAVSNTTLPVNLGTAAHFAILAKSGVVNVPTSAVVGDVGISPAPASYITGFALTADATNVFSTAPEVTGKIFAADYAPPSPANMTTAIGDMQTAFTDAAGRPAGVTELGAGNVGGMTLAAGVYKWGTGLLIPADVTLAGSATGVWVLQIAQNLTVSSAVRVHLSGGALAKNVFWQVSGLVDVGTTAHLEGTVLCMTSIALHTGASIGGRLMAQTAVNIDGSNVTLP